MFVDLIARFKTLTQENLKIVKAIEVIHLRPRPSQFQLSLHDKPSRKLLKRDFTSLNYLNRKQEQERIDKENQILFNKLYAPKINIKKSKLDDEYQEHKRQLSKMSKAHMIEQNINYYSQSYNSGSKHDNNVFTNNLPASSSVLLMSSHSRQQSPVIDIGPRSNITQTVMNNKRSASIALPPINNSNAILSQRKSVPVSKTPRPNTQSSVATATNKANNNNNTIPNQRLFIPATDNGAQA